MMRLAGATWALGVLVAPAFADVPPELLAAAQRLPAAAQLDPILRGAPCAYAEGVRHLGPLPAALAWTRPDAIVVFAGLPGQAEGTRAVLLRPPREMMVRLATQRALAERDVLRLDHGLARLPADAPVVAFVALLMPAGTEPPADCTLRTGRP